MKSSFNQFLIVETYQNPGEPSSAKLRVRPLSGQGFPTTYKVECSRQMRSAHPVGTKFKIEARLTDRQGGTPFLYSNPHSPYDVVSDQEAADFIADHFPE